MKIFFDTYLKFILILSTFLLKNEIKVGFTDIDRPRVSHYVTSKFSYVCFYGIDTKCQNVIQDIWSHEKRQQNLKIRTVFQEIQISLNIGLYLYHIWIDHLVDGSLWKPFQHFKDSFLNYDTQ